MFNSGLSFLLWGFAKFFIFFSQKCPNCYRFQKQHVYDPQGNNNNKTYC